MKISLNHIRFYRDKYQWADDPAPQGVDALVQKIGAQLGAVEEIIPYGEQFNEVIIARIVKCEKHPNADKLHICTIDDGGKKSDVERDEHGHIQVVCGAPNVREGLTVAWLPPGSTVPSTRDKDPFVLEARDIRGAVSNGMLASARELGLGDDHTGIVELDSGAAPGTQFKEAYNLVDEAVIDIENKMFTHRPDCFGMMGVAREIAGIQRQAFKSPEWYKSNPSFPQPEGEGLKLVVRNELPELVPRFSAIAMSGVTNRPSPIWLQINLNRLGIRPISTIVDLTNYWMVLTGQPLHAYDYDKVKALDEGSDTATLKVRLQQKGEKITLLGGKQVEPRAEAIMIATEHKVIGIGGIMGGAETEVDEHTKNIILECANFDMYSIRKTAMEHGLFTDAVTRFTKGQSPLQTLTILSRVVEDVKQLAGGNVASEVIDDNHVSQEVLERGSIHPPVKVTNDFVNARLGLQLSAEEMSRLLTNVEFGVQVTGNELTAKAPFWRTDIEIPEDIVEEIGRLYGYDHLPVELPARTIKPAQSNALLDLKTRLRNKLASTGANEVLTYSFVHGDLITKVGQHTNKAFQLNNALSPDLQYYRMSLTPSLLEKIHGNIKAGAQEFALFEIGKVHVKGEPDPADPDVPKEANALSLIFAADEKSSKAYAGAPFYQARKYLQSLLDQGTARPVKLTSLEGADLYNNPWLEQMTAPFEPRRSAVLFEETGLIWGVVGEFRTSVKKALKLPSFTAGFEVDPLLFIGDHQTYVPLSRFPKIEQDICLEVTAETTYQQLLSFVNDQLDEIKPEDTRYVLSPVDIFRKDATHKRITLRLVIASDRRTLMTDEVNKLLDEIAARAKAALSAERI